MERTQTKGRTTVVGVHGRICAATVGTRRSLTCDRTTYSHCNVTRWRPATKAWSMVFCMQDTETPTTEPQGRVVLQKLVCIVTLHLCVSQSRLVESDSHWSKKVPAAGEQMEPLYQGI